ncbi:MAG: lactate utilization protein C [Actinomycetota bacterium]|nr:lactate utilization protein C [Actinomycetota bacterium]
MTSAREEILERVRLAVSEAPPSRDVPRHYARSRQPGDLVGHFVERVADYRAVVERVAPEQVPAAVTAACRAAGVRRVVVPNDLPAAWLTGLGDGEVVVDDGRLSPAELDAVDAVVTGAAVGVAETGTIVLDAGAAQGRRALTLVPDVHVCVVRADQVVDDVPAALAHLAPRRPLTWISGPSATSDIELNRVEGVHGPRTLHVLVVHDPPEDQGRSG